jgi:hypothetical protein
MKKIFVAILAGCLIFFSSEEMTAQDVKMTAGIGLPELMNLGLRLQFEQTELGISVGTAGWIEDEEFSISGDFYYHFGGSSKFTTIRPWFLKTGLTFIQAEDEWDRETLLILVPRIGREFNISPKFGIALEAGIMALLLEEKKVLKERPDSYWNLELDFSGDVVPSAGLNLFYRF